MIEKSLTIEDCLELVAGISNLKFHTDPSLSKLRDFTLHEDNHKIMFSIAKQVFKGTALTQRQYELVKTLLVEYYTDQFAAHEINLNDCIDKLRNPLRKINTEHWIRRMDWQGGPGAEKRQMLVIRFPFNKKVIKYIEELKNSVDKEYFYEKHKHFFPYEEKYVWRLVTIANKFDKKFDIEDKILDIYNKLIDFNNNKADYIPGIYNYKLQNIPQKAIDHCTNILGEPCQDNLYKYYDRRFMYGFESIDLNEVEESQKHISHLSCKIINRKDTTVVIDKKSWTLDQVLASINELDRYPLLIVLDKKNALDEISQLHKRLALTISAEQMVVLFRLDSNPKGNLFNHFVREQRLNNIVDKQTKVVYISNNKVPKPLIKTGWVPVSTFTLGSKKNFTKVDSFITGTDLYMQYDDDASVFMTHSHTRYMTDKIEKI
jgi:hypothetical protein